jgi:hypothetical protein
VVVTVPEMLPANGPRPSTPSYNDTHHAGSDLKRIAPVVTEGVRLAVRRAISQ